MSQYDTHVNPTNTNTSHAQMLALVGNNKRVLDVGCSTGYLARILVDRGCIVSGVEFEPSAADEARPVLDKLVVGDVETIDLVQEFGEHSFDIVLCGDVLEHLRDPLPTLRQAKRLLKVGGSVVISIPNIGHGAVRLALLKGKWDYRPLGLLDTTHLRFFTRASVLDLLHQAGLVAVEIRATTLGLFETELGVKPEDYPGGLIDEILDDPDATIYQFVIGAVPDGANHALTELREREEEQRVRIHELTRELERTRREYDTTIERARVEHEALQRELDAITGSRTMRATRLPRAAYQRLRRLAAK